MFVDKDVGKVCSYSEEQVHEQSKWKDLEPAPPGKSLTVTGHQRIQGICSYRVPSEGHREALERLEVFAECRAGSLCREILRFSVLFRDLRG